MQSVMMSLGIVDSHAVNIDMFFTESCCWPRKMLLISNINMIIVLNLCNFPCQLKTCEKILKDKAVSQKRTGLTKQKEIYCFFNLQISNKGPRKRKN